jgi:hypothetical protein
VFDWGYYDLRLGGTAATDWLCDPSGVRLLWMGRLVLIWGFLLFDVLFLVVLLLGREVVGFVLVLGFWGALFLGLCIQSQTCICSLRGGGMSCLLGSASRHVFRRLVDRLGLGIWALCLGSTFA